MEEAQRRLLSMEPELSSLQEERDEARRLLQSSLDRRTRVRTAHSTSYLQTRADIDQLWFSSRRSRLKGGAERSCCRG